MRNVFFFLCIHLSFTVSAQDNELFKLNEHVQQRIQNKTDPRIERMIQEFQNKRIEIRPSCCFVQDDIMTQLRNQARNIVKSTNLSWACGGNILTAYRKLSSLVKKSQYQSSNPPLVPLKNKFPPMVNHKYIF